MSVWDALEPAAEAVVPPPLGYRGCALCHATGGEWTAYRGTVTLHRGGTSTVRRDPRRRFERLLLGSAPPGLLPLDAAEWTR